MKNVIQARLNSLVETIKYFALLGAALNVLTKLLAKGALAKVVCEGAVD